MQSLLRQDFMTVCWRKVDKVHNPQIMFCDRKKPLAIKMDTWTLAFSNSGEPKIYLRFKKFAHSTSLKWTFGIEWRDLFRFLIESISKSLWRHLIFTERRSFNKMVVLLVDLEMYRIAVMKGIEEDRSASRS